MGEIGRSFMIIGAALLFVGVLFTFFNKVPGLGRLPGDLLIKKNNFTFYFPFTTSLILSALLSLILFLCRRK